jgi:subtilisin family serine protease
VRVPTAVAVALTLLVTLALADSASAATCTFKRSAYSNGAPLGVTPGGGPVNDPIFKAQWGLTKIHAPAAWARGAKGSGVKIAVVDTGVDLHHPDLAAKVVPGKDLTPAKDQGCAGPQDENGHGTHVAGIAAASTNNGIGVAGTAPAARIMPVRVLDASGSADDPTVIAGIRYAADHGAKVINLSLGGEPPASETPQLNGPIAKAVGYAYSKGALVVAAAGNESVPLCSYPGASNKAVCVAAVDRNGAPSFYSNFPVSPAGAVGVRAPGGTAGIDCEDSLDIWSTIWPGASDDCTGPGLLGGYETLTGTSMATPFVSGLAAILFGKGLTNAQVLACLKKTSSNKGGYDPVMGYGLVDADAATKSCKRSGSGGGTSGGGLKVSVTRERISRTRLARKRKVHVTVKASRKVSVALRAIAGRHTLARKRVKLARAGKRTATVRLSKRAARYLRRHKHARFSVRWSGGGQHGTARAR